MADVCVDNVDFTTNAQGQLQHRTQAIKLANDQTTRPISSLLSNPSDQAQWDQVLTQWDRVVHNYGSCYTPNLAAGTITINCPGVHHVSAGHAGDADPSMPGSFHFLSVLVNGNMRIQDSFEHNLNNTHWNDCSDDLGLAAGDVLTLEWTVRYCNPDNPIPAPVNPCGRNNITLPASSGNHFSIHRVGGFQ